MSETTPVCPGCGKPLPSDLPMGLCPQCLVKSGLGTNPGSASRQDFTPPTVEELAGLFPQFEILGLLGRGGMGAVYQARQKTLDRPVALKILPPNIGEDSGFAERFNREARALARLNHPNIVTIFDFGRAGALYYLVMEFVEGANLRQIEQAGRLTPREALQIIPQICDALQFAHDEGIVHRDIKPENILLDKRGRVKVTDFGIAKVIGVTPEKIALTGTGDVVGTPHYMAPEQIERPNAVDHRADIYSLGVVFYELLTGELPLGRFAPPSDKAQVDVRLDDVVLRTLEKDPGRRYQHASEVKTATQVIAGSAPMPSPPPIQSVPPNQTPPRKSGAGKLVAIVAGLIALAVVVIGGMAVFLVLALAPRKSEMPAQISTQTSALHYDSTELTAAERRDALMDLKSSDSGRKQLAAAMFANAKPTEPRNEVVEALIPALGDASWAVRQNATQALGVWGTTNAYQPLVKALDDPQFAVRWAAISALSQWKDTNTAAVLAAHMTDGTSVLQTGQALRAIGAPAEDAVDGLLNAKDPQVRYEACRILKDIGTKKSVPALTAVAEGNDGIAAMLAKDALDAIGARQ